MKEGRQGEERRGGTPPVRFLGDPRDATKLSVDLVRHCPPRVPRPSPLKLITGKRSSRIRFPSTTTTTTTTAEGNTDAARLGLERRTESNEGSMYLLRSTECLTAENLSLNERKKAHPCAPRIKKYPPPRSMQLRHISYKKIYLFPNDNRSCVTFQRIRLYCGVYKN